MPQPEAATPAVAPPAAALTIQQFCEAHHISEALYYKLKAVGDGPVEMHVGSRRLISPEAAADWRRQQEQASAREKVAAKAAAEAKKKSAADQAA